MTKRKSFIIHFDSLEVLNDLTNEQAGELFKAIKKYHENGEIELNGLMKAVFVPFKNQFDRDLEKYNSICERNRNNGLNGGRKKSKVTQNNPLGYSETQTNPKEPDNKNKNDSKNDIDKYMFDSFYSAYPRKVGKAQAQTAYEKVIKKGHIDHETLISRVREYAAHVNRVGTEKQFIPHPATWLNGHRWDDDLTGIGTSQHNASQANGNGKGYGATIIDATRDVLGRIAMEQGENW